MHTIQPEPCAPQGRIALILSPADVQSVVDKLPPAENRREVLTNVRAAVAAALPAIEAARDYFTEVELVLHPLADTMEGVAHHLGEDLWDEVIGDVHGVLSALAWGASPDDRDWRNGLAELRRVLS